MGINKNGIKFKSNIKMSRSFIRKSLIQVGNNIYGIRKYKENGTNQKRSGQRRSLQKFHVYLLIGLPQILTC